MIYLYIFIGILMLTFLYFIIKKIIRLRITWNEHKSLVFDINQKTTYFLSTIDKKVSTIDKKVSTIDKKVSTIDKRVSTIDKKVSTIDKKVSTIDKKVERKSNNIENKLNSIQHELLLDHLGKIAKDKKDKKLISSKTFREFKKLLHNYKMDNRIKELLNKK